MSRYQEQNPEVPYGETSQDTDIFFNTTPYIKFKDLIGDPYDNTKLAEALVNQKGTYVHEQAIPESVWYIRHNLGRYPSVTTVDSTGRVVIGRRDYIDENTVKITFISEFSGNAYLN